MIFQVITAVDTHIAAYRVMALQSGRWVPLFRKKVRLHVQATRSSAEFLQDSTTSLLRRRYVKCPDMFVSYLPKQISTTHGLSTT